MKSCLLYGTMLFDLKLDLVY